MDRVILVLVLFLLLTACKKITEPISNNDFNSKITFELYDGSNYEIYIINIDGSGLQNLSNTPQNDFSPSFSPDGSKVIFTSSKSNGSDIYIINSDGTDIRNITNKPDQYRNPKFTPDGQNIIFEKSSQDGIRNIYLVDINGNNEINLSKSPYDDWNPVCSPIFPHILFQSNRGDYGWEICIMDADGKNQNKLSNTEYGVSDFILSPTGQNIYYTIREGGDSMNLYSISQSGLDKTFITKISFQSHMNISLDGSSIMFEDFSRNGNFEIYNLNLTTYNISRLTDTKDAEFYPQYNIDGSNIVCSTIFLENDLWGLVVFDSDGNNRKVILKNKEQIRKFSVH